MPKAFRRLASATGVVLAVALHANGQTIKREPITPLADVSGGASFKAYCSVCHGISGKGDGPAAKALKVPPADLTQIARRSGGKFPTDRIRMTLVGESAVTAHGDREMPMWGPLFRSVDDGSIVDLRVRNLVVYLERIQEK
jgi:mono/diheme cytochrome c family protein